MKMAMEEEEGKELGILGVEEEMARAVGSEWARGWKWGQ